MAYLLEIWSILGGGFGCFRSNMGILNHGLELRSDINVGLKCCVSRGEVEDDGVSLKDSFHKSCPIQLRVGLSILLQDTWLMGLDSRANTSARRC